MEDREVGREDRWAKSRRPGKPEHGLGEGRGGRLSWSPVPRGEEPSGRPARPPHRARAPASSLAFPFAPKKWNLLCSASPSCALSRCCLLLYPSSRLTGGSERTAEITGLGDAPLAPATPAPSHPSSVATHRLHPLLSCRRGPLWWPGSQRAT